MTTTTADAEAYAERVRAALADLPPADRDDLLADLTDHLTEVAGEDPDRPLADLLGPPEDYAAELRSSAGLAAPRGGAGRALREFDGFGQVATAVRDFLPELRPGWWVLRAVLVSFLLTVFVGAGLLLLVVLAAVLVPASVVFGRWVAADRRRRWVGVAADAVAVLAVPLLLLGAVVDSVDGYSAPTEVGAVTPGSDGPDLGEVTNLYPYSSDGRPLTGVLLYDQDGNPVRLRPVADAGGNPITRVPRYAADGEVVDHVYPQEQTVEVSPTTPDGTPTVRRVPAPIVRPPVLTPR